MSSHNHNKIKVLHMIPHDGIGGVESAARSMAAADQLTCDFKLILISGQTLEKNNHRVEESPFRSSNNPLAHFHAFRKVLRARPEVLICSLWRTMPVGLLTKLFRSRTRVVCFFHSVESVHFLDRFCSRLMLRFCDEVWADSQASLDARAGSLQDKPARVISFVTSRAVRTSPENTCVPSFVFWGRLHPHKGLDRALNFIHALAQLGCDARFEIWGPDDSGEKAKLLALVKALKIDGRVKFMGPARAQQLAEIAERNAFFLQLSRLEGAAMSVMEAMQFGLVPVITPVGEMASYGRHLENAIMVDNCEDFTQACSDVQMLLADERICRKIQRATKESWSNITLYAEDVCAAVNELAGEQ